VLLVWGDSCEFFPARDAERLASDFPRATLRSVPGAKTWVPVDAPDAVADAIAELTPAPAPSRQPVRNVSSQRTIENELCPISRP
jgi:hypothetical protein